MNYSIWVILFSLKHISWQPGGLILRAYARLRKKPGSLLHMSFATLYIDICLGFFDKLAPAMQNTKTEACDS